MAPIREVMMYKKLFSVLIVFVMLVSTFSIAFAETAPGTCPRGNTVRVGGKQGFHSTNPDFKCQTKAYKVKTSAAPVPRNLKFVRPVMNLENKTIQPKGVVFSGKAQVYFYLNKNQQKAWKQGRLAIYFYDKVTKTWYKLPSSRQAMKGNAFRLVSPIYNYGLYGLAMQK